MDLMSDILTRIRNANLSKNSSVTLPALNKTRQLVTLLKHEGFIQSFHVCSQNLIVYLTYKGRHKKPIITNLKSISTPGRRIYIKAKQVPQFLGGLGVLVLSTSKGIITNKQARYLKVGGELLCSIW